MPNNPAKSLMSDEAIRILQELHKSGQTGIIIIIIALGIATALSIWIILQQRRAIGLMKDTSLAVDQKLKSAESNMKSADSLREESRKSQEISQRIITDRIDSLVNINDELRKEIQRLEQKQTSFEESVKKAIEVGIEDIKNRVNHATVSEILEAVPKQFRSDLEKEIIGTSERVVNHFVTKLRDAPDTLIDQESLTQIIRHSLDRVVPECIHRWMSLPADPRLREEIEYHIRKGATPEYIWERYGKHYMYPFISDEFIDHLADRIARRLRDRYM